MIKKLSIAAALFATIMVWGFRADAIPIIVNCISCGSTSLSGAGMDATISYAVISGADFYTEVFAHFIEFNITVPGGTLDAVPDLTASGDFVYLYQLVNTGNTPISSYEVSTGGATLPSDFTGGGRLESTLFVDPGVGLVSAGPAGATTGLSGGQVDFANGLYDEFFGGFTTPCGADSLVFGVPCSNGTENLLASSVQVINFDDPPSSGMLDSQWSSSIMWFSTPIAPGFGSATIFDVAGSSVSGTVAVPTSVPEPASLLLLGSGLVGIAALRRKLKA